jgi:hypothetical protein
MDSIPPTKLARIAHDVAFELRLPWRIEELRAKALEAYPTAKRRAATSGLPPSQTDGQIRRLLYGQVKKAGERMEALPFGEKRPAPERIEAALGTFTSEQWESLLEGFGQVEVEALLSFIHQDADRLKKKLGTTEVGRIEERASLRENVLWVENNRSTLEAITDPYWAVSWEEDYRLANTADDVRPAKGRSLDEERRPPDTARRLSKRDEQTGLEMEVTAYKVKQWRNRAEELPFEQYVADVGADDEVKRGAAFIDYWAMIRNTAAYKKYLDAHKHQEK